MAALLLALSLFADGDLPVEEVAAGLSAQVSVDPITGAHEFWGEGHRVTLIPGTAAIVHDGRLLPLTSAPEIREGRLWIPREAAGQLRAWFRPASARPESQPPPRKGRTNFRLAIDPGHGGIHTGGKSFGGRLMEKDVALDIALILRDLLQVAGVEVIMTRTSDTNFSEDVHEDLQRRLDSAARHRADAFLSIHLNWSRNSGARGFEVYVPRSGPHRRESQRLSEGIHDEMRRRLATPDRGIKEAGFYVLRNCPVPAVLVELEFLSNPQGERDMMSRGHRRRVAEVLLDGVLRYVRTGGE